MKKKPIYYQGLDLTYVCATCGAANDGQGFCMNGHRMASLSPILTDLPIAINFKKKLPDNITEDVAE